jgi:hypothetical protein
MKCAWGSPFGNIEVHGARENTLVLRREWSMVLRVSSLLRSPRAGLGADRLTYFEEIG